MYRFGLICQKLNRNFYEIKVYAPMRLLHCDPFLQCQAAIVFKDETIKQRKHEPAVAQ